MANGNGMHEDVNARVGILSQRTANLESGFLELRKDVNQQIAGVTTAIGNVTAKLDERFNAISASMAERNRPQWQAIGVALTFAVIIGGMAYWPIRESTTDLKQTVAALALETNQSIRMLADKAVTREELNWRSQRTAEDRQRSEAAIADIRSSMLPRNEWMERNASRDHDIDNIRQSITREVANLQRQIDLQRSDFGSFSSSLGNGRDVIQNLQTEINRLRDQLLEIRARQFQATTP